MDRRVPQKPNFHCSQRVAKSFATAPQGTAFEFQSRDATRSLKKSRSGRDRSSKWVHRIYSPPSTTLSDLRGSRRPLRNLKHF